MRLAIVRRKPGYASSKPLIKQTAVSVVIVTLASVASAQHYPVKQIRLVHGFLAGGNVDLNARIVAGGISQILGQQVLVEGRPGAGGTVAAAYVARSQPDGYTLFLAAGGHAASPSLYRSLPYDAVESFTFISLVTTNPYFIATHPSFPARTVPELVRIAKKDPGKLDYATGGVGTGMHLVSLLFQSRLGVKMNHIPYRGGTATPSAVAGGEVPLMFGAPGEVQPLAEAGKLRLIGVTSAARWKLLPNVPTLSETVLPGFDVRGWSGLIAPANLPATITTRLNEISRTVLSRPDVIDSFRAKGSEPAPTGPDEARRFVASEVARWSKVIRDEGIPQQN